MKCVVPGCDTDDNVVSYTSVFYVNLPDDPIVQQQWFTLMEVTDSDLMQALSYGEVKVCSCHFAEDSFGRHPVHGYRYLPPTAMPTVLSSRNDGEKLTPTKEPIAEKDNALDYFLVYLNEPASIDQVAQDQTPDAAELSLMDDLDTVEPSAIAPPVEVLKIKDSAEEALEENDEDEPVEEIGIEYANGKYYFLKLDDDPATSDNEARASEVETNDHDDRGPAMIWEKEDADIPTKIGEIDEETPNSVISNASDGADEVSKHNKESSSDSESVNTNVRTNEVRLKKASRKLLAEENEFTDSDPFSSEVYEIVPIDSDKDNAYDESEMDQIDVQLQHKYETLSEAEYGSIEALDDESVCSDDNWKQKKEQRPHRFFCDVCGIGFQFKSLKERHLLTHTKEKKFSCEVCGKGFSQKVNLTIHMRIHTGESPVKKFTCQICQKKCVRLSELEMHRASHFRRFPHVCPICTARYSDATGFYDHFLSDHRGVMTLTELFELLSQNENNLVISGKEPANIKTENGTFGCTVCGKSYRLEINLERHKRKMHMKIFSCPHCTRKFPYKSLLEKHMPTHTLEKPFKCPHCALSYTQRVNLRKHIDRKHTEDILAYENLFDIDESGDDHAKRDKTNAHPQTYDCEECGKRFPRKPSLLLHLAAHANCTSPVTFDCDLCGISLCARVSLMRHQIRVHGERSKKENVLGNLELRNVTIVPTDDNQYVEIEDETDTIVEDYGSEC